MKKNLLFVIIIALFCSCNFAPKPYKEGMKMMKEGKFEFAVEMFKKVTIEDKRWLDSALLRKNDAFELLVKSNDWERTLIFIEKEAEDKSYKKEMKSIIINYSKELIEAEKIDTLMLIITENEKGITQLLDSTIIPKISTLIADIVFVGNWKVNKGSLKGCEIYFEKEGDLYIGKSNKSKSGWNKDKTIYKVSDYKEKMTWRCKTRLFRAETRYSYASEYFSEKGTVKIYDRDSIIVDYKSTSERYITFVRIKEQ